MPYRPADFSGLMQDYTRMYSLSMDKAQRDRDWAREDASYAVSALDNLETIYFDELETYKSSILDPNSPDGLSDEQISDFNERFAQKYPALQREAGKIFDKFGGPKWAASGETDPDSPVSIIPNMLRKGAEFLLVGKNKDGETVPKTVNGTSKPDDPLVSMSMLDLIRNTRYSIATEYGLNPFSKVQVQARGQGIQELAKEGRNTVGEGLTTDTASTGPTLGQAADNSGASSGDASTVNVNVESNPVDASSNAAETSNSIRAQQARLAGMFAPVGGMMDKEGNVVLPEGDSTTPRDQASAALGSYYDPLAVQDQVMGTGPYDNPVARLGQTANLETLPTNPNAAPPQIDKLSQQAQRRVGLEYDPQFATPPANPEAPDRRELGQLRNQEQELERRGGDPDLGAPTSAELNQRGPTNTAYEPPVEKRMPTPATEVETANTPAGKEQAARIQAEIDAEGGENLTKKERQAVAESKLRDTSAADTINDKASDVAKNPSKENVKATGEAIVATHGVNGAIKTMEEYLADSTGDFFTRGKVDPYTGTAPSQGSTAQRIVFTAMAQEAGFFGKNATDLANMRTFIQTGRMPDEIKSHFENQKNLSAAYKSYVEAEYEKSIAPLKRREKAIKVATDEVDLDRKAWELRRDKLQLEDEYTPGTMAYRERELDILEREAALEKERRELQKSSVTNTSIEAIEDGIDKFAQHFANSLVGNVAWGQASGSEYWKNLVEDLSSDDPAEQKRGENNLQSLDSKAKLFVTNPSNMLPMLRAHIDQYGNSSLLASILKYSDGTPKQLSDLNQQDLANLAASGGLRLNESYQAVVLAESLVRDAALDNTGVINGIANLLRGDTPMNSRDVMKAVYLGQLWAKEGEEGVKKVLGDDYGLGAKILGGLPLVGSPEDFIKEITALVAGSGMGSAEEFINHMSSLGKQLYIQDNKAVEQRATNG
ncbi:MAG: hypothetical protein VW683_13955 [Betaproteobacteria bacterium]